jgi:hypothetical protein
MTIREEIALMFFNSHYNGAATKLPHHSCAIWREKADQILSIKGIRIEAENQELPLSGPYSLREAALVRDARNQMLKDGWVKCEKEEQ